MKGTIPHGMTRLTGFCLCTLKQSKLPAPETLSLESAALYWASLFGTKTFWALRHPFNTKPSSVKSSSAQLHCWAARKHPEEVLQRTASAESSESCCEDSSEGTPRVHELARTFTQRNKWDNKKRLWRMKLLNVPIRHNLHASIN